jgi:hypothetical protein
MDEPQYTYEISVINMVELEGAEGWTYADPRSIGEGEKTIFNVYVRQYSRGDAVDLLEDEDFDTWDAADARAVELEQKYPGAVRDDY